VQGTPTIYMPVPTCEVRAAAELSITMDHHFDFSATTLLTEYQDT